MQPVPDPPRDGQVQEKALPFESPTLAARRPVQAACTASSTNTLRARMQITGTQAREATAVASIVL